jgi:CrcB protein
METPRPNTAPVDTADSGVFAPAARSGRLREHLPVVVVVALGGAVGASARYGASLLWPTAPDAFPWTTLAVNVTGCAVMGIFMVLITEVWSAHRLLRPFVGTGILGGYTTFSTYTADIVHLVDTGHAGTGLAYLALTLISALTATWSAAALTHSITTRRTR